MPTITELPAAPVPLPNGTFSIVSVPDAGASSGYASYKYNPGSSEAGEVPSLLLGTTLSNQGNGPYWVAIRESDATLFVLITNDGQLKSYNISNPGSPVLLNTLFVSAGLAYLVVSGNYVYVTSQTNMTMFSIDASNPANLVQVGSLVFDDSVGAVGGARCDITPNGNYLCIGGAEAGARANRATIVNVSTPSAPTVAGRTAATGSVHRGVACLSNTAFSVADRDNSIVRTFDMTNVASPTLASSYQTLQGSITTPLSYDMATSVLYAGNYLTGFLFALDMANISNPVLLKSVSIPVGCEQIALTPTGRALVACRPTNTLIEINRETPSTLSVITQLVLPATVTPGVGFSAGFAYATAAGDNTNGKIFAVAVDASLAEALDVLQDGINSVNASKAGFGANTFTATQTITVPNALALTSNTASIGFSSDTFSRLASGAFNLTGNLTTTGFLANNTGSAIRVKTAFANSQNNYVVNGNGETFWGDGSNPLDTRIGRTAAGVLSVITGSFRIATPGQGLRVAEGTNAKQGVATLVAGVATVSSTSVTAVSRIFIQRQTDGGTVGASYSITRSAGTSFTITAKDGTGSNQTADTSTVAYEIFEPA